MSLPYSNKKYILFTDFDGTLSDRDSNDLSTMCWRDGVLQSTDVGSLPCFAVTDDLGYGREKRMQSNQDTLNEKICFRYDVAVIFDTKTPEYN